MAGRVALSAGLLLGLQLLGLRGARAEGGVQSHTMEAATERLPTVIPLTFGRRLTLVMPTKVRMAVPGAADVLVAHVRDEVVVVSLIDSPWVQQERPETHVAILAEDGLSLTVPFKVAGAGERVPDLFRVVRGAGLSRPITADMLAATEHWLRRSDAELLAQPEAGLGVLEPLLAERAARGLARDVAQHGVTVLSDGRERTKDDFIYLTRSPVVRVGGQATVQLALRNHSQPRFDVGAVTVRVGDKALPAEQVVVWGRGLAVPPDGEVRAVGLVLPAAALEGAEPTVEVCEAAAAGATARCVALPLD